MEELNEQRAIKLNAIKAAGTQVKAIEERKAEAEAYQATEAAIHDKRSALYQKRISVAGAKASGAESELEGKCAPAPLAWVEG